MTNTTPRTPAELAAALGVPLEEVLAADAEGRAFIAETDDLVDAVEVDENDPTNPNLRIV